MRKLSGLSSGLVLLALVFAGGCGDSDSPGGTAVVADLTVVPDEGTVLTDFAFDAGASTTGDGDLVCRWDWDGDGTWDTDWSALNPVVHRFAEGDTMQVIVEVTDGSGADADTVSVVVDTRHGHLEEMFDLPRWPSFSDLAHDGSHIWITAWNGGIYKFDALTGDSLAVIPGNSSWTGGIAWDGSYLHTVGSAGGMRVFKQDPATGAVVSSFLVIYSAHSSGLDWDGSAFYYGSSAGDEHEGDGRIHRYSTDGTELSSFPAPRGSDDPRGVAFDGVNAWVVIADNDSLFVVDPDDGAVLRVVDAPNRFGGIKVVDGHLLVMLKGTPRHVARMVP